MIGEYIFFINMKAIKGNKSMSHRTSKALDWHGLLETIEKYGKNIFCKVKHIKVTSVCVQLQVRKRHISSTN